MEYKIQIGQQEITLSHENFDDVINVDDLTRIDTSNLFGEAVTISAATNRIGLLKAEVGGIMADLKLEIKIFEGAYKSKLRSEASKNSGNYTIRVDNEDVKVKLTESSLNTCFHNEEKWIELEKQFYKSERNFNALDSLYWAVQDKSRKLNGLVSRTTPEDFIAGIIEGKINGILIQKSGKNSSLK
jgi:hypothetical protein